MPVTLVQKASKPSLPALPSVVVPGLYVHVPFCFHKCHYCDFYSITHQSAQRMAEFVDDLLREADQWTDDGGPRVVPRTVFFGGGTPSLLPAEQMERLISGLKCRFDLSNVDEWTVEVNPATADADYLCMLRKLGVDRISMGAQSFDRTELATLERHHEPDDVPRGIELARAAGFKRINIDLIFAIPGQSIDSWLASLERAMSLNLSHYSCYGLTYEPNTPLGVKHRLGQIVAQPESTEVEMFNLTRRRLRLAGIDAYEISNYAAPGEQSLHNLTYWTGQDYIGLGPSAASHVRGTRFKNVAHLARWQQSISEGRLALAEVEALTTSQRAGELVMLALRLSAGLSFAEFEAATGLNARTVYADILDRFARQNLIECDALGFRVHPSSVHLSDAIAAEFLGCEIPSFLSDRA